LLAAADEAIAALGHLPLEARALLLAGQVHERLGDYERAQRLLERAARAGARAHDDRLVANATVKLVWVVGYGQARHDVGLALRAAADTALARAGEPEDLQAEL